MEFFERIFWIIVGVWAWIVQIAIVLICVAILPYAIIDIIKDKIENHGR